MQSRESLDQEILHKRQTGSCAERSMSEEASRT